MRRLLHKSRMLSVLCLAWGLAATAQVRGAEDAASPTTRDRVLAAVDKALPLIQQSAREFTRQRECFGCHHQAMSVLALAEAERRGFGGLREELAYQAKWTHDFVARNRERYVKGSGTGGQADTAGYAMWTLKAAGYPADDVTSALAEYLIQRHADRDHWGCSSKRPPTEASDITTTCLALQGLKTYGTSAQQERIAPRWEAAAGWLRSVQPVDTEDHVFLLRALHLLGEQGERAQQIAAWLLQHQEEQGGWRQIAELEPDAYATATALTALLETGHLQATDANYQRGREFLLSTQLDDGSWRVATRSKPIQVYFESGFPHEQDQFLSMAATCWSVIALLQGEPELQASPAVQVLLNQAAAWNRGDIEGFLDSYWKSDQLSFSAEGATTRGWQATAERFRQRYATKEAMGRLTFSHLEETPLGADAALVLGNWRVDRDEQPLAGNFSVILRRLDERWVIVHDHTSVRKAEPPASE